MFSQSFRILHRLPDKNKNTLGGLNLDAGVAYWPVMYNKQYSKQSLCHLSVFIRYSNSGLICGLTWFSRCTPDSFSQNNYNAFRSFWPFEFYQFGTDYQIR